MDRPDESITGMDDYEHFFTSHSLLRPQQPGKAARLVRFLTFTKAFHLLNTSSLHFTRLDKFMDTYEGLWTNNDVQAWGQYRGFDVARFTKQFRLTAAISCWSAVNDTLNEERMWQTYICNGQGVAIVTTASALCEQMRNGLVELKAEFVKMVVAHVEYVDRQAHSNLAGISNGDLLPNTTLPYYQKSDAYRFENEVRLLLHAGLNNGEQMAVEESGVNIPVEPQLFIEEVWLPPSLSGWEHDQIKMVLNRYDLAAEIRS